MKPNALTLLMLLGCMSLPMNASAQETPPTPPPTELEEGIEDEVIATARQNLSRHDGMKAFFDGDFTKAEIEFEREFLSLKRGRSAIENAAFDAENSQIRSDALSAASSVDSSAITGPGGGGVPTQSNGTGTINSSNVATNFRDKRGEGRSVLMDGKVTYQDFAVSKYMAGLSEIKLGKYDEAKKSLKSSLSYDSKNHDAQMRLGLLYLKETDFEKAAKHLRALDKLRKTCKKRDCEDYDAIEQSTLILAKAITRSTASQ